MPLFTPIMLCSSSCWFRCLNLRRRPVTNIDPRPGAEPTCGPVPKTISEPTHQCPHILESLEGYFNPNPPDNTTTSVDTSIPFKDLDLTSRLEVGTLQVHGGTADVYDGILRQDSEDTGDPNSNTQTTQTTKVAVKVFRVFSPPGDRGPVCLDLRHILLAYRLTTVHWHHYRSIRLKGN